MEQLTIFDTINDKTLWYTDYCNWCDERLPRRDELNNEQIVIRVFEGPHGHLVLLGYHTNCYPQWAENEELVNNALVDSIVKSIT